MKPHTATCNPRTRGRRAPCRRICRRASASGGGGRWTGCGCALRTSARRSEETRSTPSCVSSRAKKEPCGTAWTDSGT